MNPKLVKLDVCTSTYTYHTYIHAHNREVLAQKQKYRSMKQDRKPRDKPTHIWSPYL